MLLHRSHLIFSRLSAFGSKYTVVSTSSTIRTSKPAGQADRARDILKLGRGQRSYSNSWEACGWANRISYWKDKSVQ